MSGSELGRRLVARVENDSRQAGIHRSVLLTQTAEPFFERFWLLFRLLTETWKRHHLFKWHILDGQSGAFPGS